MKNRKLEILEGAIHDILSPLGFKRHKRTWRKGLPNIVQVVHLDKGTWGPQYHLEYGLHIAKLCGEASSASANHVRWTTAGQLPRERHKSLARALDLDTDILDIERAVIVRDVLADFVIPAFTATDTLEKLRAVLSDVGPNPFKTPLIGFTLDKL